MPGAPTTSLINMNMIRNWKTYTACNVIDYCGTVYEPSFTIMYTLVNSIGYLITQRSSSLLLGHATVYKWHRNRKSDESSCKTKRNTLLNKLDFTISQLWNSKFYKTCYIGCFIICIRIK